MSWLRLKSSSSICLGTLLLLVSIGVVHAQGELRIQLSDPLIENFPNVSLYMQVIDETGSREEGLQSSNFQLSEDGVPLSSFNLHEALVGTRLIFALNTDVSLRVRDTLGRSRFDLARQALLNWWHRPDASQLGLDDLTLMDAERVLAAHSDSAAELASILDQATPTFSEADTGYELLFRALDFVGSPEDRPGMPSSVIFITSLLRQPRDIPLTNIITRARGSSTAIYPVLVGPTEASDQPELDILRRLAQETGGRLILFNEAEGLSSLADLILAGRTQYELNYLSAASESGPHEIRIQLADENGAGPGAASSYVLEIQPAEVTLLGMPTAIERKTDDPAVPPASIPPTSLVVQYAIRFPDGYARPIQLSQLIVDGVVASQQTEPPFDSLKWDLSELVETSTHSIQIAVVDSLGLKGTSLPATISLEVQRPPAGLTAIRPALGSLLAALVVLVVGIALASYLISGRRLLLIRQDRAEQVPRPSVLRRAALQRELPEEPAEAVLIPMTSGPDSPEFIPLVGMDTILGRDPSLAAIPIEDPSVDRMHARLIRQADGEYMIRDQGSIAGTWVNYREIPESGVRLKHGDLVHLGEVLFRFQYVDPPAPRQIHVEPEPNRSSPNADEVEQVS